MKTPIRVPVLRILPRVIPAIRAAVEGIADAAREDSPGGKKITVDEWEEIGLAVAVALAGVITDELRRANA